MPGVYVQQGSWVFRSNGMHILLNSGRNEGEIYNAIVSHSEDYGETFIQHSYNGFFGNLTSSEIDNQNNIGYGKVFISSIPDSIYLLITYDNFENLEIKKVFNGSEEPIGQITRGEDEGELFTIGGNPAIIGGNPATIRYCTDYGETWEIKNTFMGPNLPFKGIVGGRQPGELYLIVEYTQLMHFICHTFIYNSLDYGETFTIYHPIAIGPDPIYADFEATPTEGSAPLTVQFTDLSGGDPSFILGWEWDFDDDGVIDSYEQHPEYTYQDTGLYSVRLLIFASGGIGVEAYAYRKDYIHVTEGNSFENEIIELNSISLSNYPNPFNPSTIIYFTAKNAKNAKLEIYNLKGQKIYQSSIFNCQSSITWDGTDNDNKPVPSGIYLYKVNVQNSPVKKMILMK